MALAPGTRLGPYKVEALIGVGGMGEVYKASDTRLGRTVAIKIISPDFSTEARFLERFEREASILSGLNHPNICTLYDVGEADGARFVVMEFLEGLTLAEWIVTERNRLGPSALLDRVLALSIDIADALDHAHCRGVVHRDLKPANILITPNGLKVVDFGLAKALRPQLDEAPTEASITRDGSIVGTLPYLAPELIDGGQATARSDVWSFGCVMYEALTGRRAFDGTTTTKLIAAINSGEVLALPKLDPTRAGPLQHLQARCLARDPIDRWQTGHDLALELRWIAGLSREAVLMQPARLGLRYLAVIAALIAAAVLGSMWRRQSAPAAPTVVSRFSMLIPQSTAFNTGGLPNAFAISPDGSVVAHLVWQDGRSRELQLRRLDSFESVPVAGSENAIAPFFSPDGSWVGFLAGNQIRKAPMAGGPAIAVASTADSPSQPSWSAEDRILFADSKGVSSVSAAGGQADLLVPIDRAKGEVAFNAPSMMPDGRVLFAIRSTAGGWNAARIVAHSPSTKERTTIIEGGYAAKFLLDSHLVFSRAASVFAVRLEPLTLKPVGSPEPVLDRPINNATFGWSQMSVSQNGTLLYSEAALRPSTRLVWVDRSGRIEPAVSDLKVFEHPRISPDGERFTVGVRDQTIDIWLGTRRSRTLERFTFETSEEESAVWHPDGRRIAYAMNKEGQRLTVMKPIDGGADQLIGHHGLWHHHLGAWTPDGGLLSMSITESTGTPWNMWFLKPGGPGAPERRDVRNYATQASSFAPNGKWIVYASDESGRSEVYVDSMPGLGKKRQVSPNGGREPLWSRDGKEVFYRNGDQMMVAGISTGAFLHIAAPRVLFDGRFEQIEWGERDYDVAPDGRFLMVRPESGRSSAEIRVVVGWLSELRQRTAP